MRTIYKLRCKRKPQKEVGVYSLCATNSWMGREHLYSTQKSRKDNMDLSLLHKQIIGAKNYKQNKSTGGWMLVGGIRLVDTSLRHNSNTLMEKGIYQTQQHEPWDNILFYSLPCQALEFPLKTSNSATQKAKPPKPAGSAP